MALTVDRSSSYLYTNKMRFHYLAWDNQSNGNPVVLLHGLASNARIWDKTGPRLAVNGLRVFALDQRGHGLTDKPEDGYDFEHFTRDTTACLDALGVTRPWLVGHSWGAMTAIDYAARFPMGPLSPAGIILIDGGIGHLKDTPGATWEDTKERLRPPKLAGMPVEKFLERVKQGWGNWKPDDDDLNSILGNFAISEDETIRPQLTLERHMRLLRAIWDFPLDERLGRVGCPTLAILAQAQEPANEMASTYYRMREHAARKAMQANSRLEIILMPDSIHDLPLQRPDEITATILDWMSRLEV